MNPRIEELEIAEQNALLEPQVGKFLKYKFTDEYNRRNYWAFIYVTRRTAKRFTLQRLGKTDKGYIFIGREHTHAIDYNKLDLPTAEELTELQKVDVTGIVDK